MPTRSSCPPEYFYFYIIHSGTETGAEQIPTHLCTDARIWLSLKNKRKQNTHTQPLVTVGSHTRTWCIGGRMGIDGKGTTG